MLKRWICAGIFAVFALSLAAVPSSAQEQPTKFVYSYVSEWAVPRSMWPEMTKLQMDDRAIFDKFVADGTITGYGEFVNLVHQPGEPTHGSWFTSTTQAGILHVLAALYARPDLTAPVLAASKHRDFFLASDVKEAGGTPGTFTNVYLRVFSLRVKESQGHNFDHLYKMYILPVYQKLLSEGALVYFGVDGQEVISENPNDIDIVTIAANPEALDKASEAMQASFAKNPGAILALQNTTKSKWVHSSLYLVTYMKAK
jgi:hypothetical protein